MFTAYGIEVEKTRGVIRLKVRIQNDRTKQVVASEEFEGVNVDEIKAQVQRRLQDLAGADLATLRAALVDQVVGQV